MRYRIAFLLFALIIPAFTLAAPSGCPKSFSNDDICQADVVTMQTKDSASCPFSIKSAQVPGCKDRLQKLGNDRRALCANSYNRSSKTFSKTVGWLEVKENGDDKIPFVSKCDANYRSMASYAASAPPETTDLTDREYARAAIESIDTSTDAGREQLAKVLNDMGATDVTPEKVAENPDAFKNIALLMNDGKEAEAKQQAEMLGLNPDLLDVSKLDVQKAVADNVPQNQVDAYLRAQETFGTPEDRTAQPREMQELSSGVFNSGAGSCYSVRNSFGGFSKCVMTQEQVAEIQGNLIRQRASVYWEGSRTANGEAFNPNGYTVAHPTLPFGTQVLIYNPATGQAVVATVNDRGPFVDDRNIDLSAGTARAIGFSGVGTVDTVVLGSGNQAGSIGRYGSVQEAFAAYQESNGAIAIGGGNVPANVAAQASSPFGGLFGTNVSGGTTPQGWYGGSPIGNSVPMSRATPISYNAPMGVAGGGVAAPVSPAVSSLINPTTTSQPQLTAEARALQQALQGSTTGSTAPVAPVSAIVVQQSQILRGTPILVSWSSVGMSAVYPCTVQLSIGGSIRRLASGNEGSTRIPTSAAVPAGPWVFTLTCTTRSGQQLPGQSVSVLVQ